MDKGGYYKGDTCDTNYCAPCNDCLFFFNFCVFLLIDQDRISYTYFSRAHFF
jgi:hypothetical protein